MCPVCMAAAALIAGKVTSAGGLAAIGVKRLSVKRRVEGNPSPDPLRLSAKENGKGRIVSNLKQRRDQYGNDRDGEREDRVA
jgi:hypothetical protein